MVLIFFTAFYVFLRLLTNTRRIPRGKEEKHRKCESNCSSHIKNEVDQRKALCMCCIENYGRVKTVSTSKLWRRLVGRRNLVKGKSYKSGRMSNSWKLWAVRCVLLQYFEFIKWKLIIFLMAGMARVRHCIHSFTSFIMLAEFNGRFGESASMFRS